MQNINTDEILSEKNTHNDQIDFKVKKGLKKIQKKHLIRTYNLIKNIPKENFIMNLFITSENDEITVENIKDEYKKLLGKKKTKAKKHKCKTGACVAGWAALTFDEPPHFYSKKSKTLQKKEIMFHKIVDILSGGKELYSYFITSPEWKDDIEEARNRIMLVLTNHGKNLETVIESIKENKSTQSVKIENLRDEIIISYKLKNGETLSKTFKITR